MSSDVSFDLVYRRYQDHVNPGMAQLVRFMGFDAAEIEAEGCYVICADGRRFLDCLGGPGVFTFGHRPAAIVGAVVAQLKRMPLSSHLLLNPVMAEAAERVAAVTPGDLEYVFFCNSGAEAVEGALKAARMYTGRPGFVAAEGAFHGKTFGALSASGRDVYKRPFEPLLPGFVHVTFGDVDALAEAVTRETAAVILEPIQCENGIRIPPDGYLTAAREICDRHGALLILDEIQTGFGRTGRRWACDWDGVVPDIVTLGKALGGGVMPVGAFVARPAVWKIFEENPYIHTSTFGGNPLACAAAIAAISEMERLDTPALCAARGQELLDGCRRTASEYPDLVHDVRGRGLLVAVEFGDSDVAGLVIAGLAQRGILAAYGLNNPKVLRFEPPAIITREEVAYVAQALADSLAQAESLLSA
ncbi:MAG: aminotransferase class III-fold pyridoxal phosphate-dependent enzyme [Armatimonadetes bacterium]|nr:aminotransferase class III-fold pyridoxal phosphate-dependent enzyme [Armatimonadota bacterium]